MSPARLATVSGMLALAVGAGAATSQAGDPTVSCDRIVLRERAGAVDGSHVLLGAVAVPGERSLARAAAATSGRSWEYFRQAGLAVRAGTSDVSVSVPEGWRDRVALTWGDSAPVSFLRFARCAGSAAGIWNSYSGGFLLRSRGDCVPLVVRVGGTSTTVRVGLGRPCGARG